MKTETSIGLWWGFVSWIIMFSVLLCLAPASEPPSPSEGERSQSVQNHGERHKEEPAILQRGTEASPLFIKIVGADAKKDAPTHDQKDTNMESFEQRWGIADWRVAYLTLGLVIVGAIQAGLFVWQLLVMKKSLNDAALAARAAEASAQAASETLRHLKETAEVELRAYVGIVFDKEHQNLGADGYRLAIKNSGKTPAHKVRGKFGVRSAPISEAQWPASEPYSTPDSFQGGVATLSPDQTVTIRCIPVDAPGQITFAEKRENAYQGKETIYFYGTITYEDVYRKESLPRTTNFCFKLEAGSYTRGILTPEHNDCT